MKRAHDGRGDRYNTSMVETGGERIYHLIGEDHCSHEPEPSENVALK